MKNHNGAILILVLIVLSFMSALGLSLYGFVNARGEFVRLEVARMQALYLAEAGLARSVWELHYNTDPDGNDAGNVASMTAGAGSLWATHDARSRTITAAGVVEGVQRTVQIKYTVL